MNDLKMGFKQSLLQRLQHIDMSTAQPKSTAEAKDANNSQITDFSIQRILSDRKEAANEKTKSATPATQDTPPSSPKLYAPVATKPYAASADILDLSKAKQTENNYTHPLLASTHSSSEFPFANTPNYAAFHPNILAAVAAANAQKFYAQFLPHMFPAGFYNNAANITRPAMPYQKRYFAPYVLNSQQTAAATQPPLTPPTPTPSNSTTTSSTQIPSTPSHHTSSSNNKFICSRPDCLECLESYYKASTSFPYKTPILSPAASTVSSTSSYHNKTQKDILLSSSNISLTSVTNIHLTAATKTSRDGQLPAAFDSRNSLAVNSEEISYKCRICDKVFGCSQTLQAHEKTHKSPRYECTDCGKGFSQLRNYKYHLSVHRGTKEFAAECPECGKTFNDKGYLSSHMKIHRNKKEYECPYCPKSFNQRVAFNMHVRIHTGVKPHKCAECGKRFSRKMLLKQHMRTHSGEKPYQCSVCGKSFADRSNMTLHHRLHSGIKPFNCPICPKAFTKKHHLKTHLNYHTGCKPYVCPHPNCNQAFTQSSNMRTHAKKCQYRPLQMTYPVTQKSTQNTATTVTTNQSSLLTTAAVTSSSSSSLLASGSATQSFMLNTISRLPSSMSVTVGGNHLASSLSATTNNSNSSSNCNNNSSSIPFIPSTTLAAGIRMLSTVTSAMPIATIQSSASSSSSSTSSVFPPAQQPLLSTLRPF